MKVVFRSLILLVAAAAFLAITQRREIQAMRTGVDRAEAEPATIADRGLGGDEMDAEIRRLRAENRDIHKLRGQISQAREKRREIERMEQENAQLGERIKQVKGNPKGEPFPLANKGQGTPDTAVETAFWSMYHGDYETLTRIMPMITTEFDRMPPAERTNSITMLRVMAATIARFEILDRQFSSADEARLKIQITRRDGISIRSTVGGDLSTFVLKRTNDVWQIVGER